MGAGSGNSAGGNPVSSLIKFVLLSVAGAAFFAVVLGNLPGMILFYGIQAMFNADPTLSQRWTFSLLLSLAVFGALYFWRRDVREAAIAYCLVAGGCAVVFLVAHFGLLAAFPGDIMSRYFG